MARRWAGLGWYLRYSAFDDEVGDALHALPGHTHSPGDVGDGAGLVQHRAEHLPPRGGQAALGGEALDDVQKPTVEPEGREDHFGQHVTGFSSRGRRRSVPAWRHEAVWITGDTHAESWACMRTGNAAASAR